MVLLKTLIPEAVEEQKKCTSYLINATDYSTYMASVICVRVALGSRRIWPGKIRLYRKAHAWVRDRWMTSDEWCDHDFMIHGWKVSKNDEMKTTPFLSDLDPNRCGVGYEGWNWKSNMHGNASRIRELMRLSENYYKIIFPKEARVIPFIDIPDIYECYPYCDKLIRSNNETV
ncbi:hypothetical protein NECAME_12551 [Necator americanus]|uniref:Uncharacterized protein n=1 Tax=Necator americanus TaxID=51031 RepID=W2T0D9_NECAM|nr:hypothetical protein NECAME_12551 [Necator americanus]ETN75029.1 hypothetical protein NECAME_12551 [Necator americanus]